MIATESGTGSPCTLVDCKPDNPFRPLDWRWVQAGILRERCLRPRSPRDDEWVRRALRFRRAGARLGDMPHPALTKKDTELSGACRIQFGGDHRLRWEVEARLLADQAPGEIASRCGVSSAVVEAFEKVFYDVRERLVHTDHIYCMAIGPRFYDETITDLEVIAKAYAYSMGPLALDALIDVLFGGPIVAENGDESCNKWTRDADLVNSVWLAIVARNLLADERAAHVLLRLVQQLGEDAHEAAGGTAGGISGPIRPAVEIPGGIRTGEHVNLTTTPEQSGKDPEIKYLPIVRLMASLRRGNGDESCPDVVVRAAHG